jgi:hypothetical protein
MQQVVIPEELLGMESEVQFPLYSSLSDPTEVFIHIRGRPNTLHVVKQHRV